MTWPLPRPGLVIRYSCLWQHEAQAGRDKGVEDRPCAVIVASTDDGGRTRVYAVPITHSAPSNIDTAIEIPTVVKARLDLDGERSWVVVSEANVSHGPAPIFASLRKAVPMVPHMGSCRQASSVSCATDSSLPTERARRRWSCGRSSGT